MSTDAVKTVRMRIPPLGREPAPPEPVAHHPKETAR